MNIVKQEYIEGPLVKLLNRTLDVVGAQLRDFTALHPLEGVFVTAPEYPKFAWQEGVVNAVTHRAYNIHGDDSGIEMFDDRLLIRSPGIIPQDGRQEQHSGVEVFAQSAHRPCVDRDWPDEPEYASLAAAIKPAFGSDSAGEVTRTDLEALAQDQIAQAIAAKFKGHSLLFW